MFDFFKRKSKAGTDRKDKDVTKGPSKLAIPIKVASQRSNSNRFEDIIKQFEQTFTANAWGYVATDTIRKMPAFKAVTEQSPTERAAFLLYYAKNPPLLRTKKTARMHYGRLSFAADIFSLLIRRKSDFTVVQIIDLLKALKRSDQSLARWAPGLIINQLEKAIKRSSLTDAERKELLALSKWPRFNDESYYGADPKKAHLKLLTLISGKDDDVAPYPLSQDEVGTAMWATLDRFDKNAQNKWNSLFHLAASATGSKPSKKLSDGLSHAIQSIGTSAFKKQMHSWLDVASKPNAFVDAGTENNWNAGRLNGKMANLMKGLVWGMARFHDDKSLSLIAKLAEKCFERLPGVGPAAPALGNACIYTLATSKGLGGVAHLSRLKLRIKQNNTQKLIQKHIETNAAKQGLKAAEIEDMAAPDFDLELGHKSIAFKDYTLKLTATSPGQATFTWHKPDGSVQKSVPSFVKDSKALTNTLKNARDLVKDIKKASTAQRDRIDRLYTEDMSWEPEAFENYYLNHGLIGPMARKLIWQLSTKGTATSAIFNKGRWENVDGKALKNMPDTFQLWHPIMSEVDEVIAWRTRLEALEICQPFKQAYREVYILTDAEINTRLYSNRMAAHILKQHQFNTLSAIRGWKYQLMGAYDDGRDNEVAIKPLPAYGLSAEFWIDELNDEDSWNDAGIWDYVATDQVRFKDVEDNTVNLIEVPPIILSEILRDADLFVGVASVGNDPTWADRGGTPRTRNYWQSYSFGDLNETAKTRKSVLENLLPRLKLRNIAKIDGKFLIVQGKRHSYKIHIGSGNILIQPSDRYLCIVPGRGKDKNLDNVFLPFEGDRGLSVVLSKAFMLADDDKIKDPTILSQL